MRGAPCDEREARRRAATDAGMPRAYDESQRTMRSVSSHAIASSSGASASPEMSASNAGPWDENQVHRR